MRDTVDKPLLFVDIDGVLNPYAGPLPPGFVEHRLFPQDDEPVRVNQDHGAWLHELAERYDLVWGTAWTAQDREVLGGVLALPEFVAAVDLPAGQFDPALKVPAVERVARWRPLAWFDDLLTDEAYAWARARPARTFLLPIDPAVGLTRSHVDRLLAWAATP